MKKFTFGVFGWTLLLVAAFEFSVSAEDGLSHELSIGGGNDWAWLNVNKLALGGVDDDRALNKGYISVKYKTPLRSLVDWGGVDLEYGHFTDNSMFWGIDVGFGLELDNGDIDINSNPRGVSRFADKVQIGGGLSCGPVLNLPHGLRVILGMSLGFWYSQYEYDYNSNYFDLSATARTYDLFGPFLKIQCYFIEIMYRGLLGFNVVEAEVGMGSGEHASTGKGSDFDWNQHQLMVGFYLNRPDNGGYTFNRRLGTMALNCAIPGLGSMTLMKDYLWGGLALGVGLGGAMLTVIGTEYKNEDVVDDLGNMTGRTVRTRATSTLGYIGWGMEAAGYLTGLIIPWIHSKPDTKTASGDARGFNFAILPKDGDLQYVGTYKKSF
jgi:hypothetical protein